MLYSKQTFLRNGFLHSYKDLFYRELLKLSTHAPLLQLQPKNFQAFKRHNWIFSSLSHKLASCSDVWMDPIALNGIFKLFIIFCSNFLPCNFSDIISYSSKSPLSQFFADFSTNTMPFSKGDFNIQKNILLHGRQVIPNYA